MRKKKFVLIVLIVVLMMQGCQRESSTNDSSDKKSLDTTAGAIITKQTGVLERSEFIYGTLVQIKLYEGGSEELLDTMIMKLRELDSLLSTTIKTSDVYKINAQAGVKPVVVSDETLSIVESGLRYSLLSKGSFDITVEPLVMLWGIGSERAKVPTVLEIKNALGKIDYQKIIVDSKLKTIFLPEAEMGIDLGAIAKGFAADEMVRLLKENGVTSAIVNLGGNVIVLGNKEDDTPWRVGIQNPNNSRGEYLGIVQVSDQTIVTSGIYERYFEESGKRYHHILDTHTGYPVENNVAGVSIVTNSSIDADALSTVAFTLGIEKGIQLIDTLDEVEILYVTKNNELYASEGFKSFFKLTDDQFKWGK